MLGVEQNIEVEKNGPSSGMMGPPPGGGGPGGNHPEGERPKGPPPGGGPGGHGGP